MKFQLGLANKLAPNFYCHGTDIVIKLSKKQVKIVKKYIKQIISCIYTFIYLHIRIRIYLHT